MGKSNSKIIDIKDAERRCSMEEWKRFNEGYEEVTKGNKANRMDKRSFHNDVLGDWCPVELAYRIFDVFATKKDGFICKQEFLCGMAIFHRGTQLEQLGLLFTIYDEDGSGGISKQEMHKYIAVLRSLLPTDRKYAEILDAAFRKVEDNPSFFGGSQTELSFEVFKEWALTNMTPGLISWVFDLFKTAGSANIGCCFAENNASSNQSTNNSWFKSDSKSDSRFFGREMAELESYYHRTTLGSSKLSPLEAFAKQFPPNLKPELIRRLHHAFDKNRDGVVDANEFVAGMAMCCRGTHDENVKFVFSLFDSDCDGMLSREELTQMVSELLGVVRFRLPSLGEQNRVTETEVAQFVSVHIPEGTEGLSLDGARTLARSTRGFTGLLTLIREHAASELGIQPLDLQEEKRLVEPILPLNISEMKQGGPVYVVSAKWYVSWMFYMGFDGSNYVRARSMSQCSGSMSRSLSPKPVSILAEDEDNDNDPGPPALLSQSSNMRPGEIDNSGILEETTEASTSPILKLKPNLKEFTDYIVVSPKLWFMLQRWYGGGPTIEREVIVAGDKSSTHLAELYPLVLNCRSTSKKGNQGRVVTLSRMGTVLALRVKIATMMELEPDKIRLWDIYKEARPRLLEDKSTLESAQLVPEQDIYVETQMENGRWAGLEALQTQEEKSSKVVKKQKNALSTPRSVRGQYNSGGVCGMYNLGNTCFMNSSLQCLSNARPLTYYFLSDYYLHEINRDNPLGSEQADLVMNYAKTIKKLWAAKPGSAISPRAFKAALGKFAPRFSGSQQQDAQELLSGVLDALHEDLNRVLKKPYVEDKDSAGRDDRVVAAEYWSNFRLRNQSVINDLFMAQLKSTLDFTCGFQSVRFDAYSCLSVPLPEPELEYVGVTVVFDDPLRIPTKYSIALAEDALIADLKAKITALCGCPANTLQLLELDGTTIVRWLTNNVSIGHIKSATGIHAYEIPRVIAAAAVTPDAEAEAARAAASKAEADAAEKAKAAAAAEAAFDPSAADVGAQLDVLDTANQWLLADVLMTCKASKEMAGEKKLNGVETNPFPSAHAIVEGDFMVYVHYQNWSSRWDEWISTSNKKRFAVPNTKSVEAALKKQRGGVAFKPFNRNDELNVHKETIVLQFVHRRLDPIPNYFFHPWRPVVFDIPILLFVLGASTSVASLYASIWSKVRRYTTSPSTKASALFSRSPSKGASPSKAEDVKEDNSPPFVLKHVKRNATICFTCPWLKGCLGCPLEYSDQPLGKQLEDASTIAIDWNPDFLKTFVRKEQLSARLAHASVAEHASKLADSAVVSIADCMAKFTIREVLDDQSTPRCSKCKDFHKNTTKTLELWSVPAVFIIHLKRLLPGRKLYTKVEAPLTNFDPSPFCASSGGKNRKSTSGEEHKHQLYDLFAVVNHYGSSLGGHYLAYALNKEDNQWYVYDDNHVAPLPADHPIITINAYMLFYQRHDLGGGNSLDYIPPETLSRLQSQVGGRDCAIS